MEGQLEHELDVCVPAVEVWDVYKGLKLGKLVCELLPYVAHKIEVIEGDGGVGTVLRITLPPGKFEFASYKEKFTKIDEENRVKEVEVVEGGVLDLGFSLYKVRFEIIDTGANSSIIRSTIDYKADNDNITSFVSTKGLELIAAVVSTKGLELIAAAVGKHLAEKKL